MVLDLIHSLLDSCSSDTPKFPPTILYNEGWLLRIILEWFSTNKVEDHPLIYSEGSKWFSEARIPSTFLARYRGDPLAESWTHLDGVIGHFTIGISGKTDLSLSQDATQFIALEAKMFSGLSSGVSNASYFDQAARNVACIAEVLKLANSQPSLLNDLGFYVLAPKAQIEKGVFTGKLRKDSIQNKVERRVKDYEGEKDSWNLDWFLPTLQQINIHALSWEELINIIQKQDNITGEAISGFYQNCVKYNL